MNMEINKARFYTVTYEMTTAEHERFNIGTYKEKKLHRILKLYFEEDPAFHEIPYAGFIADIKRENQIIEIETSGFTGLREKLNAYLPECRVLLVYPIASCRTVSWIDPESGEISPKRKSPKKENVYDLLFECIYIADYLSSPNLTVAGVCMEMQEYRMLDGWSRDKKRGSHRYERIPTDLYDIITLSGREDYEALLPEECQKDFTMAQFCRAIGRNQYTGRAIMKILIKLGIVVQKGKIGRCLSYSRASLLPEETGEIRPASAEN